MTLETISSLLPVSTAGMAAIVSALIAFGLGLGLWCAHRRLRLLTTALEASGCGLVTIERGTRVLSANRQAARLLGRPEGIARDTQTRRLFGGTLAAAVQAPGDGQPVRGTAHRPDHGWFPATLQSLGPCGGLARQRRLWLLRDLSDGQELERLRKTEERFNASQRFGRIGVWDWNIKTNEVFWSDEVFPMFGFTPNAITPTYDLFIAMVHPDDFLALTDSERACLSGTALHDQEYRVVWRDGSIHWIRETADVLRDPAGAPRRMVGVIREVTEEKEAHRRALRIAMLDPLTGLPNRATFLERLDTELSRTDETGAPIPLALAFIDLDDFKPINDTYGHLMGDRVLMAISKRLNEAVRPQDMVARVGGDEFVALLWGCRDGARARTVAARLLDAVTAPVSIDTVTHRVRASIGISLYPSLVSTRDDLIATADQAMYVAKRSSGHPIRLHGEEDAGEAGEGPEL
ncbi:diguanylate cyclase [Rhodospirillum rubrum]|uniref:diguanylate cyclase domain-containing protein n=1 Tax=Rhodospirillum rubrum TaxID=1085 RepID=UPI001903376C|nr:diguanylate cyclase [Rhodospirillum rubrum]MBK1665377.1 diguanylate cyclase [Rhodospirillum rubrum]MBK1677448.1 diguanylate cyclase [Rhodospirillum rubrum]